MIDSSGKQIDETLRASLDRRMSSMDKELNTFLPHYRELTDFLAPRTARYLTIDTNKGQRSNQKIINATATKSIRTLKSGMHAGMTSPARPWFRLMTENSDLRDSGNIKQWLYIVEEKMRVALAKSNFYNTMPMLYGALGTYGTTSFMIIEDDETLFRCYAFPTGSYCLALDGTLRVDTLYRKLPMTVRQVCMTFGYGNCSKMVQTAYDKGDYTTVIEVGHAIEPNDKHDPSSMWSKDKKIRSCYWETGSKDKDILQQKGFDLYPAPSPRWDIFAPDDIYGYSPGMDALGAVKGLQLYERRKAQAVGKMVNPPMLADSTLRTTGSSIIEGGITYIDNLAAQQHAGLRPAYQFNPQIGELRVDINEICQEIRGLFYEDLMLMFSSSDNPQQTAREVEERHGEKLLVLGPVLERLGNELYDPAIKLVFDIMMKKGEFPPPPEELQGQALKVEYTSVMAQAQKLIGTASVENVTAFVGNLIQIGFPEAGDILNADEAVREYASMYGTPPTMINSPEVVKEKRALKQKAAQAQQMAEMLPSLSQGATAAKTLSEIDPGAIPNLQRMGIGGR